MANTETCYIPCPKCKEVSEHLIYFSVNTEMIDVIKRILGNEINFAECEFCKNRFHVKAGFLFNNIQKKYAIYFSPTTFQTNEQECRKLKTLFGEEFYLANPSRFNDWDTFKQEIRNKEGLDNFKFLFPKTGRSTFSNGPNRKEWVCSICDGNSDTGCMYFDPTECPRHT